MPSAARKWRQPSWQAGAPGGWPARVPPHYGFWMDCLRRSTSRVMSVSAGIRPTSGTANSRRKAAATADRSTQARTIRSPQRAGA